MGEQIKRFFCWQNNFWLSFACRATAKRHHGFVRINAFREKSIEEVFVVDIFVVPVYKTFFQALRAAIAFFEYAVFTLWPTGNIPSKILSIFQL